MTVDALRAGLRLEEIEIDLEHRATTRSLGGFAHRGRQLAHFLRATFRGDAPGVRLRR